MRAWLAWEASEIAIQDSPYENAHEDSHSILRCRLRFRRPAIPTEAYSHRTIHYRSGRRCYLDRLTCGRLFRGRRWCLLFLFALVELPGLTATINFVPMGEPRPVQGSQPGPALKPTGVPE